MNTCDDAVAFEHVGEALRSGHFCHGVIRPSLGEKFRCMIQGASSSRRPGLDERLLAHKLGPTMKASIVLVSTRAARQLRRDRAQRAERGTAPPIRRYGKPASTDPALRRFPGGRPSRSLDGAASCATPAPTLPCRAESGLLRRASRAGRARLPSAAVRACAPPTRRACFSMRTGRPGGASAASRRS